MSRSLQLPQLLGPRIKTFFCCCNSSLPLKVLSFDAANKNNLLQLFLINNYCSYSSYIVKKFPFFQRNWFTPISFLRNRKPITVSQVTPSRCNWELDFVLSFRLIGAFAGYKVVGALASNCLLVLVTSWYMTKCCLVGVFEWNTLP